MTINFGGVSFKKGKISSFNLEILKYYFAIWIISINYHPTIIKGHTYLKTFHNKHTQL